MKPNERCWCGSGAKWKKCHKYREQQQPINIFEHAVAMREKFAEGFCLATVTHGSYCGANAISSHTIQRRGGLAAISEQNHVLTTKFDLEDLVKNHGTPVLKRVSTKKASTFPGFCAIHDAELFEPIERPGATISKETASLLAYRAICMEYFRKSAAVELDKLQRKMDYGTPFPIQAEIQMRCAASAYGTQLGMRDAANWKAFYETMMAEKRYEDFRYYEVRFSTDVPMVMCGAWQVETDFEGNWLQKLGTTSSDLEHITVNLTKIGDSTSAVFGWAGTKNGPAREFVESFKRVPDDRKSSLIASMAFEHSENVFMRPSWWDNLTADQKSALLNRIPNGTASRMRSANALLDDGAHTMPSHVESTLEAI
ncbi:SEC-C metal-binding domain-containing protein [Henriciella sp.]|uniref:SEC-C metal-binding domain-containing protein n=1 Tax=Henriciella sp. TaxID=1968823 RepID=UPI0026074A77|nr:SEC-C metal-binding domain-containing protein [Henriciella sp.]